MQISPVLTDVPLKSGDATAYRRGQQVPALIDSLDKFVQTAIIGTRID